MRFLRPRPLTTRPRVSVVIPCYNYGHFLADAVRSATEWQPHVDVEVWIVDDASPDGSGEVARELAARDTRISVLQHEVNRGHLRTYNDGLAAATGDYVVLLSADDLLAPHALSRATALMESHPDVGLVYGQARSFEADVPDPKGRMRTWTIWSGDEWLTLVSRRHGNPISSPEVVMRRSVLDQLGGGYDLRLPHTADLAMWLAAAQVADVGRVNGGDQAYYRVHGANMHLTQFDGVLTDITCRAETIKSVFGDTSASSVRLRRVADRAAAFEAVDVAAAAYDVGHAGLAPVEELAALARELWPPIVGSVRWRLLERRARGGDRAVWMRAAEGWRSMRHRARWQRCARLGI